MKPQRAFTLMELLVVIAAAALLAGIALPSLQGARRLAKPERCKWNQAKVAEAIFLYAEDNDDAIPYTLNLQRGASAWPLSWDVHIGRIPERLHRYENYGCPHAWTGVETGWEPWISDPNSPVFGIVTGGYVDFPSWGCNFEIPYEGAFICPAFVDQVSPKSRWAGGTSNQFSINGNVSDRFNAYGRNWEERIWIRHLSDVRLKAVLIGDGNLNPGGEIMVDYIYRTDWRTGRLFVLNPSPGFIGLNDFGPWTHQKHIGKWSLQIPCDFYGHPGQKCNLALADGHVKPAHDLDHNDWIIEPLDEEQDGNE